MCICSRCTILDSKASGGSGGGNLDTCAVTFRYVTSMMSLNYICYMKAGSSEPELVTLQIDSYGNYDTILENVICNTSIIALFEEASPVSDCSSNITDLIGSSNGMMWVGGCRIYIPTSGGSGTITLTNDF